MRRREPVDFAVFIHERGKRPRFEVTAPIVGAPPLTWTTPDGRTFHFTTCDLSQRTLTYGDMKP